MADENNGGNFLKGLAEGARRIMYEDGGDAAPAPAAAKPKRKAVIPPPETSSAAPAYQAPTQAYQPPTSPFQVPTIGAPTSTASPFPAAFAQAGAAPVDEEALAMINGKVFPDGEQTLYVQFEKLAGILRGQPPAMVLVALSATVPSANVDALAQSINEHIARLDKTVAEANADISANAEHLLGTADATTAELIKANKVDQDQIDALNKAIAERSQQIANVQTQRQINEQKIMAASQKIDGAVQAVRTRLTMGSAAIANIPQT